MRCFSSEVVHACSEVPQGSHLGPLLSIFFINVLKIRMKYSEMLIYAGDTKIFMEVSELNDCMKLQNDLEVIYDWSIENRLPLYKNKTKILTLFFGHYFIRYDHGIGPDEIERVTEFRDLGVIYNCNFNFNNHLEGSHLEPQVH